MIAAHLDTISNYQEYIEEIPIENNVSNLILYKFPKKNVEIQDPANRILNQGMLFNITTSARIHIEGKQIKHDIAIFKSSFLENFQLINNEFDALSATHSEFVKNISITGSTFNENIILNSSIFRNYAFFWRITFKQNAFFNSDRFLEETMFTASTFNKAASFEETTFERDVDFTNTTFISPPNFSRTTFKSNIILCGCNFVNGVDFLESNIKGNIVFDKNTEFPNGKLYIHWEDLKGKLTPILPNHKKELYDRLNKEIYLRQIAYNITEKFYEKLRDNYIAQGDKSSADEVMYELASKKQEYIGGTWWKIYGIIFGWGYKPLRFAMIVFFIIIPFFAVIWHRFFLHRVTLIIDKSLPARTKEKILDPKNIVQGKRITWIKRFDHKNISDELHVLARVWHVIFFSSSVLLSVRFNKDWIARNDKKFLTLVTIEWVLGLSIYVLFFTLVKSHEFEYIKSFFNL